MEQGRFFLSVKFWPAVLAVCTQKEDVHAFISGVNQPELLDLEPFI